MSGEPMQDSLDSCDVAIIGMAGRFPGAKNVDEFWQNLKNGVEGISFFKDGEMEVEVAPEDLRNPNFVRAKGVLDGIEFFDAPLFSIPAREAEWMDPQQRLFLESVWAALENAGYDVSTYGGQIALYAGVNTNTYLLSRLDQLYVSSPADFFHVLLANEKDHLATRVSYKLNLRGESITIQTSCSTSLVAVHLACQSLLSGQSDMALAGGVSIRTPQKVGYFYQDGMIASPDGHCRAFDHKAQGTLPGHGLGVVVLKLLPDAVRDGDHIYAVIKGSAINNDGHMKMGYTAPSVEGQSDVIRKALSIAGVSADSIGFIEAHGTGTPLGDPIEVEALKQVYRQHTARQGYCALGSVKTNIGHLDNAAGVAGLIKTVLSLKHRQIVPTLHFEKPNPALGLESSPFYVPTRLQEWTATGQPRRAAVSSFGIGGTNAHVILEEAPAVAAPTGSRPFEIITLSAKTRPALEAMTGEFKSYLEQADAAQLPDIAFTRNTGRQALTFRKTIVAANCAEALTALASAPVIQATEGQRVVFMFAGQGTQSIDMGRELYENEPSFRQDIDGCAELLKTHLGTDLRRLIYPTPNETETARRQLAQPSFTLPALFTVEYATARLWMSWGVKPAAMIGHSFGEYLAACLAGVLSREDALALVAARGRLMQQLPPGAMLAVRLSAAEATELLSGGLSIASINSRASCAISGPVAAIERLEQLLADRRIGHRRLDVPYAYHSEMIDAILPEWLDCVARVKLNAPVLPYISGLTGTWMKPEQACDPNYWAAQMRQPVRFADGLETLRASRHRLFVEIGPNDTLAALAREHFGRDPELTIVASLQQRRPGGSQMAAMLKALGQIWACGGAVDWHGFNTGKGRRRVPLPVYPFERHRYWIEPRRNSQSASSNNTERAGSTTEPATAATAASMVAVERSALTSDYAAPRNEIEVRLAEIWSEVLGVDRIGIHDNLFELGGDSLLATQIHSRIKQGLATDIPLQQVLRLQTIAELSQAIQEQFSEELNGAAPAATGDYYCAFDIRMGDEAITAFLSKEEFDSQGLPEGAENFRLLPATSRLDHVSL